MLRSQPVSKDCLTNIMIKLQLIMIKYKYEHSTRRVKIQGVLDNRTGKILTIRLVPGTVLMQFLLDLKQPS